MPVAVQAERAAHAGDEADAPDAVRKAVLQRRRPRIRVRHRFQRAHFTRQHLQDVVGEQDSPLVPEPLRVQRHELDVAHLDAALAGEPRQRHDVRLDELLHRHGVELDRAEAQLERPVDAGQHAVQLVAPRDVDEALTVERVQMNVEPPQPGVVEIRRLVSEQHAVGGEGNILDTLNAGQFSRSTCRSRRTSGSPPVIRSFRTPMRTARRANRSISSKLSISG